MIPIDILRGITLDLSASYGVSDFAVLHDSSFNAVAWIRRSVARSELYDNAPSMWPVVGRTVFLPNDKFFPSAPPLLIMQWQSGSTFAICRSNPNQPNFGLFTLEDMASRNHDLLMSGIMIPPGLMGPDRLYKATCEQSGGAGSENDALHS